MSHVVLDRDTYEQVRLLGAAWEVSESEAVARLVRMFPKSKDPDTADVEPGVAIHAVYAETRVEGIYDPRTQAVTITTDPLEGERFKSPTGAARAVVSTLRPTVSPHRNGWGFWTITDTDRALQTIR